jgi:hypothetical protein
MVRTPHSSPARPTIPATSDNTVGFLCSGADNSDPTIMRKTSLAASWSTLRQRSSRNRLSLPAFSKSELILFFPIAALPSQTRWCASL